MIRNVRVTVRGVLLSSEHKQKCFSVVSLSVQVLVYFVFRNTWMKISSLC